MKSLWVVLVPLIAPLLLGVGEASRIRLPSGAGLLYPADAATLRTAIEQYLAEVDPIPLPGPVVECIVPHSSLPACGSIVASAVKPLRRGQYDRVVLLAPALFSEFRGCSIPAVQYYRTPLGDIELDGPAIHRVTLSSLIQTRAVVYRPDAYVNPEVNRIPLHEREFAAEVVLPFLQVQLGDFKLIPIVVGNLTRNLHQLDAEGPPKIDDSSVKTIAQTLSDIMDDQTLLVVCTEFTRYGAAYNFTPFRSNVVHAIAELDMQAFKLIQARQYKEFETYLTDTKNTISGKGPILVGMRLLARTATGILMGYDVSARTSGNLDTSVSYGAIVFVDATRPMPETAQNAPSPAEEAPAPNPAPAPEAAPAGGAREGNNAGPQ